MIVPYHLSPTVSPPPRISSSLSYPWSNRICVWLLSVKLLYCGRRRPQKVLFSLFLSITSAAQAKKNIPPGRFSQLAITRTSNLLWSPLLVGYCVSLNCLGAIYLHGYIFSLILCVPQFPIPNGGKTSSQNVPPRWRLFLNAPPPPPTLFLLVVVYFCLFVGGIGHNVFLFLHFLLLNLMAEPMRQRHLYTFNLHCISSPKHSDRL